MFSIKIWKLHFIFIYFTQQPITMVCWDTLLLFLKRVVSHKNLDIRSAEVPTVWSHCPASSKTWRPAGGPCSRMGLSGRTTPDPGSSRKGWSPHQSLEPSCCETCRRTNRLGYFITFSEMCRQKISRFTSLFPDSIPWLGNYHYTKRSIIYWISKKESCPVFLVLIVVLPSIEHKLSD